MGKTIFVLAGGAMVGFTFAVNGYRMWKDPVFKNPRYVGVWPRTVAMRDEFVSAARSEAPRIRLLGALFFAVGVTIVICMSLLIIAAVLLGVEPTLS